MTWSRRQTSLVACASGGRTNQSDGWLFWSMPALEQAPFRLHGHVFLRWPLYENRTTWFGCSFRLTTVCKTSMNWDCLTHAAQFKLFTSSERQRKQQTRPLQQLNARRSGAPFFHVYWLCSNPHWHCFTKPATLITYRRDSFLELCFFICFPNRISMISFKNAYWDVKRCLKHMAILK